MCNQSYESVTWGGIINVVSFIDKFSLRQELFLAISSKNEVKSLEKEYLFPTLRSK